MLNTEQHTQETDTLHFPSANPTGLRCNITSSPSQDGQSLTHLSFLQLNCHISKEITLTLLHHLPMETVLILQEPWVNPHTLLPPTHPNWHLITSYNHNPVNWRDQHKCCVYIH